jgi:hypothetical protein
MLKIIAVGTQERILASQLVSYKIEYSGDMSSSWINLQDTNNTSYNVYGRGTELETILKKLDQFLADSNPVYPIFDLYS